MRKGTGTASGVMIDKHNVLTAGHVCKAGVGKSILTPFGSYTILKATFELIDIKRNTYTNVRIVSANNEWYNDVCIMHVPKGLKGTPVPISNKAPEPGDRAYNVAAPKGIFAKGMVPMFSGYYLGVRKGADNYSIHAAGGSSGSPIVNARGELIGMIVRSLHVVPLVISPAFSRLRAFVLKWRGYMPRPQSTIGPAKKKLTKDAAADKK